MRGLGRALGVLAAGLIAAAALGSTPARAEPRALSPWDAQLYAAAFDAVKKGDFAGANARLAQVQDKCLVGVVEFEKLFHPTAYKATYTELATWLEKYNDLPMAPRVRALARKRKAEMDAAAAAAASGNPIAPHAVDDGTVDPKDAKARAKDGKPATRENPIQTVVAAPVRVAGRTWEAVEAAGRLLVPPEPEEIPAKAAREALNAGELNRAYDLAVQLGDHWVAGLASWRRGRYDEAYRQFQMVALDVSEDGWIRSGGAYWAARSAIARGAPEDAVEYLEMATRWPYTFYGIIAERQLGMESNVRPGPKPYMPQAASLVRASADGLDSPPVMAFIRANPRAKRAVALAQLGQKEAAGIELRMGMAEARDDATKNGWTTLALGLDTLLTQRRSAEVDAAQYPIPGFIPDAGPVDRALLFALMRRESHFEPTARSSVGAYGLMQVMPQTAAWLTGDANLRTKPELLWDPATNMRVGQAYIGYLASQSYINNDILRIVAAYNGGPQPVMVTQQRLPRDADALLFMESIPVPQTRVYIEEVMAAYWIYRQLLGEETRSLDLIVSGARTIPLSADFRPAPPTATPAGAPPAVPAVPATEEASRVSGGS
ncbi:MAG TPA: lytic transglycosylase domain-containing protein [Caulobacteraceae bacterium]|nr:lytic transglycosylase domain-containing protein [Caulobacteraceae bacterium]